MTTLVNVVDGEGNNRKIEFNSKRFKLLVDDKLYEPAVTTQIEVEQNGNTETTGTQCGEMKQTRVSSDPFKVTISGIITKSEREEALTPRVMLFDVREGDYVSFQSDFPISQAMEVSNVIVRQIEEMPSIYIPSKMSGKETAFEFELELGAEENNE